MERPDEYRDAGDQDSPEPPPKFDALEPESLESNDSPVEKNTASNESVAELVQEPSTGQIESEVSDSGSPTPGVIKTSWLHPSSLIFEMLSHFRELLIPVTIAIFSAAQGSVTGLIFAVVFFVPAVIYSVFRYFTLRYKIDNGELVVKQGLVFRRTRTVPINRIQNVDLVQNILHRLFRVAEVKIETASGNEAEARLRVLSMQKIEQLRHEIFRDGQNAKQTTALPDVLETSADIGNNTGLDVTTLLEIPSAWLLKAGLASNRGLLIIGIVAGLWFQFDLEDKIDFDRITALLPTLDGSLFNVLMIAALGFAVLLFLRLLGIVWYFLRFHGYRLAKHGEDLRISCGLFTRVSATVPRNRVQFISIHRPLFMKWFGLSSVRIETAGGGAMGSHDNASTTVSRRWFVPVVSDDQVAGLMSHLRPGLEWNESALDWKPLADGTGRRLIRLAFIQALIIAGGGLAASRPWGWLAGILILPLLCWWARKKSRAMRYARTANQVIYRSGVLNRKTSLTFFDKIQTLRISQSPFDRRWKMATLSVDTAASGPAEHRVSVKYLDEQFARAEFARINLIAARRHPDFG